MSTTSIGLGNGLNTPPGTLGPQTLSALLAGPFVALAASGAIPVASSTGGSRLPGKYVITKAGVAALTLVAPTAGLDDGVLIQLISTTANAHTVTTPAAGNIQDGNTSGHNTVLTFNAHIGANAILEAYNGTWYVLSEVGCSLTS
jgi:hypothetical protein